MLSQAHFFEARRMFKLRFRGGQWGCWGIFCLFVSPRTTCGTSKVKMKGRLLSSMDELSEVCFITVWTSWGILNFIFCLGNEYLFLVPLSFCPCDKYSHHFFFLVKGIIIKGTLCLRNVLYKAHSSPKKKSLYVVLLYVLFHFI